MGYKDQPTNLGEVHEPIGGKPANATPYNSHPVQPFGASGGSPVNPHPENIHPLAADLGWVKLGPELYVNGNFATDLSGWTFTGGVWVWDNGLASMTSGALASNLTQGVGEVGESFQLRFDIVESNNSTFYTQGQGGSATVTSVVGKYLYRIDATEIAIGVRGSGPWIGKVDNLTLRKILN
jgi:hypothetical protein